MNTHVKEASFLKRFFAYVVDIMLVIIPTILLYNFVTSTYLFNSIGGDKKTSEMYAFATDSGLLKANYSSTDSSKIIGVGLYAFADTKDASSIEGGQTQAGYQEYYSRFWYYYTTFLYQDSTTNHRAVALQDTYKTDFTADQYYTYAEVALMGLPKEPEKITVLTEANLTGTSPYFKYALNDAGTAVDIHKMPILQDLFQSKVDSGTASALTSLNTYFYDASSSTATGLYANAVYDLTGQASTSVQTYYSERLNTVNYDIWLCLIVAFLPLQLIFFVIIPFTNKNEQTIGKMIFSLSVVKIDGFQTGIKEKLLHQLFVAMMGLLVILPWTMIGITCYFLLAVVDYMVLVMSKTHQSLHDRLAKTMVIAKNESMVWKDEAEMNAYAETHPEQFPELKKSPRDAEDSRIAQEDSILDLSTLNKNRDEAHAMTNFDDYEKKKESEISAKSPSNQPKVNLTKDDTPDEEETNDEQTMADLAKLEGGTPDEEGNVAEEAKPETPAPEPKDELKEDGFTDDAKGEKK
jgi:Predicted membrane protein/domain